MKRKNLNSTARWRNAVRIFQTRVKRLDDRCRVPVRVRLAYRSECDQNAYRVHHQTQRDERVLPLVQKRYRTGQTTCPRQRDERRKVGEVMRATRDHAQR